MVIKASKCKSRGFTLIELMVVLLISAILMMMAVPFTIAWMDSSRQLQARGDLTDAIGRVKAVALRNDGQAGWNAAAARIRYEPVASMLTVEAGNGNTLWSAQMPRAVELLAGTGAGAVDFVCAAYNSRGIPISTEAGCDQVANNLVVRIEGREDLNVDLL